MVEDKVVDKNNLSDQQDEKKDPTEVKAKTSLEEGSPRKTLSLGSSLKDTDILKALESKEKRIKGRLVTVEIRGKKRVEEPVIVINSHTVQAEDSENPSSKDHIKKEAENSLKGKLTEDEKILRQKVLENNNSNINEAKVDVGLSSFNIVSQEPYVPMLSSANVSQDKAGVKSALNTEDTAVNKPAPQGSEGKFVPFKPVPTKGGKELSQAQLDEEELIKKNKKKSLLESVDKRKVNSATNWRNTYNITFDSEENLDEEEVEEEEVEEKKPKFVYVAKRKSKKKSSHAANRSKVAKDIEISKPIMVQDLAAKMAEKSNILIRALEKSGIFVKPESILDMETAELVIAELGQNPIVINSSLIEEEFLNFKDNEEDLVDIPPVVTIMGHVDHGKTTLLDVMRKTSVVSTESGGITQHIGAYQVKASNGKMITFLDTPGHEAFSQIRSRGAKVTNIVVLVVAADDGVKTQTIEAINHARDAKVPMIIAINKIDKPDKNPQKVKTELLQHNVVVEELGGDCLCVEISAKSNVGIDKLLEAILLQAEVLNLKANIKVPGKANVVEVRVEKGFGVVATILVERGTVRIGDIFVCGTQVGKIKVMINDKGERIKIATPSMPVEISGFDGIVETGDSFVVVGSELKAQELSTYRMTKLKEKSLNGKATTLKELLSQNNFDVKTLAIILKADAQGSVEAIMSSLKKIIHKDVTVRIIHSGVGEITESDIMLSKAGKAVIVGFNARANSKAREIAKKEGIDIRYHSIIYNLIDDVKSILSGLLDPEIVENIIGYAEVREIFNITKVGNIAGCFITEGIIKRAAFARLLRNNLVVHEGTLSQLKRFKDDVKQVKQGFECGVAFDNYNDIKVSDLIECYEKLEIRHTVD
ncbi:Translation initiation factor IF-2 [Candidatus Hepatincolaceae symbiont of Richtersius coronifer]